MPDKVEIKVPDIGGHDAVPVIEVLVAVGDTVAKDQGLVTLESEKATMEIPAPAEGVVRELKVKVGDTVSAGAVIAVMEAVGAAEAAIEAAGKTDSTKSIAASAAPTSVASANAAPASAAAGRDA